MSDRASISGYERGEREPPFARIAGLRETGKGSYETLVDDKLRLPK